MECSGGSRSQPELRSQIERADPLQRKRLGDNFEGVPGKQKRKKERAERQKSGEVTWL